MQNTARPYQTQGIAETDARGRVCPSASMDAAGPKSFLIATPMRRSRAVAAPRTDPTFMTRSLQHGNDASPLQDDWTRSLIKMSSRIQGSPHRFHQEAAHAHGKIEWLAPA